MLDIELTATSSGSHYLIFGMDNNSVSSFSIQIWVTRYGRRAVDWLQSLSMGFVSFMGGDLWIHNSPETVVDRCNFFGEQKDMIVGAVANEEPSLVKVLDSIGIKTDGSWEVQSVTIPKSLSYPNGMSSKIPANRFKRREGFIRSEFLRNELTTSGTASVLELLKGEELRGDYAYLILKNTSTTQVKLYAIEINMTTSKI